MLIYPLGTHQITSSLPKLRLRCNHV